MTALVAPRDRLAYYDQQEVTLPVPLTATEVWNQMMRRPLLGLAGKLPPLTRALWRHAAGV